MTVTDTNNCVFIDSVIISTGTDINNITTSDQQLLIYPNPAKDVLWIEGSLKEAIEIKIFNSLGQLIINNKSKIVGNKFVRNYRQNKVYQ